MPSAPVTTYVGKSNSKPIDVTKPAKLPKTGCTHANSPKGKGK